MCEFQVKTIEVDNGLLEDQFAQTVTMSTYLVAFVICDFKSVTATTSSGVQVSRIQFKTHNVLLSRDIAASLRLVVLQVSVYAAPEKRLQSHYALEVAVKMLDFYEDYFNIRYPLPKQGQG